MESWSPGIRFVEEWNYYDYYKCQWSWLGLLGRLPFLRPRFGCRIVHLAFDNAKR